MPPQRTASWKCTYLAAFHTHLFLRRRPTSPHSQQNRLPKPSFPGRSRRSFWRVLAPQDSTLHATWSRIGHPPEIPVTGERKSIKILGANELWRARFHCRQDTIFNADTYLSFLEQLARSYRRSGAILIQDNASYHKDADVWKWFSSNRHWLEVHQLPPYSPEFNPTERRWQHTRKNGTHNRYFATITELVGTLSRVFGEMQDHPESIRSYLLPFC